MEAQKEKSKEEIREWVSNLKERAISEVSYWSWAIKLCDQMAVELFGEAQITKSIELSDMGNLPRLNRKPKYYQRSKPFRDAILTIVSENGEIRLAEIRKKIKLAIPRDRQSSDYLKIAYHLKKLVREGKLTTTGTGNHRRFRVAST